MLTQLYANNASTTLASSVSPTDTTIAVASGLAFPHPGTNQYFRLTIDSGTSVEVIYVNGVSGNSFINCVRGQEGTTAQNFQAGTVAECRVTAGTLGQFARYQDRLAEIASVDVMSGPGSSDGNSYIVTGASDDGGNPIVAVKKNSQLWRFVGYPTIVISGGASAGSTTTKLAFTAASTLLPLPVAGKYIIQFTSGANIGLARAVTGADSTGVIWSTALPNAPASGDSFEVYQSASSSIMNLNSSADNGLLFSILFSE